MKEIPSDFVSLRAFCPELFIASHYATPENFTGQIVPGYLAVEAYLARGPAEALKRVQTQVKSLGFGLKIFDAYRPVKAVAFFQEWAQKEESNPEVKARYYPKFSRQELFKNGFIAIQSSHSRGCAVDLTLYDLRSGEELDMGSCFDYFDQISWTESELITENQRANRQLLKNVLESEGFKNYYQEWWHFSFRPEPHPGEYFDFDVV